MKKAYIYIVILTAFGARLAYFLQYYNSPFYLVPMWDAAEYSEMAAALASGQPHIAWPFRPPLYPLILGAIYIIFGAGYFVPSLLQMAMGVAVCVIIQRIATRLFNATAGLVAGLTAALSGLMILFDFELLPTSIELFLLLLLIYELIKIPAGEGSAGRAGLWFALGTLARPVLLPMFPFIVWWLWFACRRPAADIHLPLAGGSKGGHYSILLCFSAWSILPLIISLIIHIAAGSGSVLVSAQGGVNFYIGNHRQSDGISATFPGLGAGWGWETVVNWTKTKTNTERNLKPSDVDNIYWKEGLSEIKADPGGWLKRTLRKSVLFWNVREISNNRDLYYHAERYPVYGWLMRVGFPLMLPLALAGAVLGWRRREVKLLALIFLMYYLTLIPFFVNARFRHPLMSIILILAAGAIVQIWAILKKQITVNKWQMGLAVFGFGLGILLPRLIDSRIDPKRWDYGLFTEGNAWEKLGNPGRAEEYYQKALTVNPRAPYVNFTLASLARSRGDLWGAADYLRRELDNLPTNGRAWNNLGAIWLDLGRDAEALDCFRQALAIRSDIPEAARNAAAILARRGLSAAWRGDFSQAERDLREAVALQPAEMTYWNYLDDVLKNKRQFKEVNGAGRMLF